MLAFSIGFVCGTLALIAIGLALPLQWHLKSRADSLDDAACRMTDERAHRALHVAASLTRAVAMGQVRALHFIYARALDREKKMTLGDVIQGKIEDAK